MKIEIIGPGCPFCRRLYRRVEQVVREKRAEAEVLHVTDLRSALKYFPRTPTTGGVTSRSRAAPRYSVAFARTQSEE